MSTARTRIVYNGSKHHASTERVVRPLRGVGQDKDAPPRRRVRSMQPVVLKKPARTQASNTKSYRSQKHSSRRRTVQISGWGRPQLKAELARIAQQEGLSLSQVVVAGLEEWVRQKLHTQHAVLLQPIIEQSIRRESRANFDRIVKLLLRIAYDGGHTRALSANILSRQPGCIQDVMEHILAQSAKTAKRNITVQTQQIKELFDLFDDTALSSNET